MKSLIVSICLFISIVLVSSIAYADNVVLPYTFQSGTPAKAAEVNANFEALKGVVDNVSGYIVNNGMLVLLDSSNNELGAYSGFVQDTITYINSKGFQVFLNYNGSNEGSIYKVHIYYSGSSCDGNGYIIDGFPFLKGSIWSNYGDLYYIPTNGGPRVGFTANSYRNATTGTCVPMFQGQIGYRVYPNDPNVTGETSPDKGIPLRIVKKQM